MDEVKFAAEDFDNLAFIEEFNKEHWKAGPSALGWNYDLEKTDPQVIKIRDILHGIQAKLKQIGNYFQEKDEFKGLVSSVQKITDGVTNRYLFQLWLYFIKGLEKKAPNEPQLQLTIRPQDINISLWFENSYSIKKYLLNLIENYSEFIKQDNQVSLEVFGPGLGAKVLKEFSNKECDNLMNQLEELKYDCKIGLRYVIPKEEVIKKGKELITYIENFMNKAKLYFDRSILIGKKFIIVNVEWNDFGWTQPQIPDKASFGYTKDGNMPHDTLNFKFDKPVDTTERIYGYFQPPGGNPPREFVKCQSEHKIIFFYSRNRIIGIYGDAEYLENVKEYEHGDFEDNKHLSNISGKKNLSFGFLKEAHLDSIPEYMNFKQMRRSTFIYIPASSAKRVIQDAVKKYEPIIEADSQNSVAKEHLNKLENVLQTMTASARIFKKSEKEFFNLLANKKQVILYGPPGTGKTYRTKDFAVKFLKSD